MNATGRTEPYGPGGREPRAPQAGDITMCTDCGAFAMNLENGGLRLLTGDEMARIANDPRTVAVVKARRLVEQEKQKRRN